MQNMDILYILIVGGIAGWLGSLIYKGRGLGLIGNIIVGIAGSFVGFWLFGKLGITVNPNVISTIITGAVGAIIILFLFNLIFGRR